MIWPIHRHGPRVLLSALLLSAFHYNLSDRLQDALDPVADLHDESGIEAFYNYAVTPWALVGVDLQYIDPARGGNQRALVAGLRIQIRFRRRGLPDRKHRLPI